MSNSKFNFNSKHLVKLVAGCSASYVITKVINNSLATAHPLTRVMGWSLGFAIGFVIDKPIGKLVDDIYEVFEEIKNDEEEVTVITV